MGIERNTEEREPLRETQGNLESALTPDIQTSRDDSTQRIYI